jgi:hypothetical protein
MSDDIENLKRLAGVYDYRTPRNHGEVIENFSATATALKQQERELKVKPGDPKWFDLWFGKNGVGSTQAGFRGRTKR